MRIYDVSLNISPSMLVWPGDIKVTLERNEKMEEGSDANVSRLEMSVHAGTHVDAPYHFLGGDNATVDQLPLNVLIGETYVVHIPDEVNLITAEVLQGANINSRTKRVLFKTRNSTFWVQQDQKFEENFVAISADGAQFLVDQGIQLVGVDYLSVAPYNNGVPTHRVLLEAGIVIIEGLNLAEVPHGCYTIYCLPLKLKGADGAPARTVLIEP